MKSMETFLTKIRQKWKCHHDQGQVTHENKKYKSGAKFKPKADSVQEIRMVNFPVEVKER